MTVIITIKGHQRCRLWMMSASHTRTGDIWIIITPTAVLHHG
ncbi:hypothetical protein T636_A4541 (plasmid) [Enterobacter hormaechei subsp. xiangfangensis]|nr:hypothetical protein T636_A4541 [Enterobacter hormaechei subsp. xiangfangensis]